MPKNADLTSHPSRDSKSCTVCKSVKPLTDFVLDKTAKTGRKAACRECYRIYQANRRKTNPEAVKKDQARYRLRNRMQCLISSRRATLKRRYGITIEQYEAMLALQGGSCAICRRPETYPGRKSLSVDHCHATGVVRGLLCNHCNRAIGFLSENYQVAQRAVDYLRSSMEGVANA